MRARRHELYAAALALGAEADAAGLVRELEQERGNVLGAEEHRVEACAELPGERALAPHERIAERIWSIVNERLDPTMAPVVVEDIAT